jgi:hypothetical protein
MTTSRCGFCKFQHGFYKFMMYDESKEMSAPLGGAAALL